MAIIKKEAYFNSSTGVNKIRTLIWQDDEVAPVAVFQIAHGVAEHIGRYDHFARFLASNGFVVCGNDHIGHGKSVACEADLGFTAEKEGYRRFVDDMHILYKIMHKRYPELPYYLFGHSMGGFAALNALATGLKVKKAFLLAPCNICYRQLFEKEKLAGLTSTKDSGYYRLERYTILEDELKEHEQDWYFPNLVECLPRDLPYTILCGIQDTVCPAETHVKPMLEKMEALGFDVRYTEHDDGHSFHASRLWLADTVVKALQER